MKEVDVMEAGKRKVEIAEPFAREVVDMALRVARLRPSHSDPERFHVEKSEIEYGLRQLARSMVQR